MGDIDEWSETQEEEDILSVLSGSGLKLWGTYSITESKPSEFFSKQTLNLSSASTYSLFLTHTKALGN